MESRHFRKKGFLNLLLIDLVYTIVVYCSGLSLCYLSFDFAEITQINTICIEIAGLALCYIYAGLIFIFKHLAFFFNIIGNSFSCSYPINFLELRACNMLLAFLFLLVLDCMFTSVSLCCN